MNKRNPLLGITTITTKTFRQSLNEDRFVYYGIAILLVVLYHLYCRTGLGIVAPFSKGAIGVDIFLFFSGYGLCYSYEKNTLKEYYWRRFKRILPIFWVNLLFLTLVNGGGKLNLWDFACNILCIPPFYGIDGTIIDWFTAAILHFYLFFPVLYFLVKKALFPVYICSVVFAVAMLYKGDLTWQQYCFTDRIPIFLLGIAFHIYSESRAKLLSLMGLSVFLGSVLFFWRQVPYMYWLIYALVCPLLLYVLYMVVANRYLLAISMIRRGWDRIRIFGKSSLEIYYGDGNANIATKLCQGSYEMLVYSSFLTIFFSYVFYCVSKELKEKLTKK